MKKYQLFLVGFLTLAVFLGIFAGLGQAENEEKIQLTLGAGPPTWASYSIAVCSSSFINRVTNLDLIVRSHGGALPLVESLATGRVDFGYGAFLSSYHTVYKAYGDFKGRPPATALRTAISCSNVWAAIVVREDSGIETVRDLKGKRIGWMITVSNDRIKGILEAYGLDPEKDIIKVPVEEGAAATAKVISGEVDAYWANLASSFVYELDEAVGPITVLPIEPEIFEYLKENLEIFAASGLKEYRDGLLPHISAKKPKPTIIEQYCVMVHEDVPEDIVYTYVKTWLENIDEMGDCMVGQEKFGISTIQLPSSIPYHESAVKALKDYGMWTEEMNLEQLRTLNELKELKERL